MSERVKAEDVIDDLRRTFAAGIREHLQVPSAQAFQCADALCAAWIEALSGLVVAMPAAARFDTDAIAADWRAGRTIAEIVQRHGCSKRTAYRYHPQAKAAA